MILLYKGKSWVSKAIKWQTFGSYSHAGWWMRDGSVIEAWHKGGVSHNESPGSIHTPGTEIDVFDVDRTAGFQPALAEKFLIEQVGKKYDFRPVLSGFLFRMKRNNPGKWFCSELCHAAAIMGGLPLLSRIPDRKIHPALLSYSPRLIHIGRIVTGKDGDYELTGLTPDTFQPLEVASRDGHKKFQPLETTDA